MAQIIPLNLNGISPPERKGSQIVEDVNFIPFLQERDGMGRLMARDHSDGASRRKNAKKHEWKFVKSPLGTQSLTKLLNKDKGLASTLYASNVDNQLQKFQMDMTKFKFHSTIQKNYENLRMEEAEEDTAIEGNDPMERLLSARGHRQSGAFVTSPRGYERFSTSVKLFLIFKPKLNVNNRGQNIECLPSAIILWRMKHYGGILRFTSSSLLRTRKRSSRNRIS